MAQGEPRGAQASGRLAPPAPSLHLLGGTLKSIYATRFNDTEYLPLLRERIATAHDDYRRTYRSELFEALLARPWEEKLEAEAFELLGKLPDTEVASERLLTQVPAL